MAPIAGRPASPARIEILKRRLGILIPRFRSRRSARRQQSRSELEEGGLARCIKLDEDVTQILLA
jgi:hypothetical protein